MTKKTFMVETSWYHAISELPEKEQLTIYQRLFLYHSGRHEEIPLTSDFQKTIWSFIEDILKKRKKRSDESADWKKDFNIYLNELTKEYNQLISDSTFLREQEKFYPNIDVKLSLEKAYTTFWSKESGWKNKKKSGSRKIDWRKTFANALAQRFNQVYKTYKSTNATVPEKQCRWVNTRTGEIRTNTHKQYLIDVNRYGSNIIKFLGYVE